MLTTIILGIILAVIIFIFVISSCDTLGPASFVVAGAMILVSSVLFQQLNADEPTALDVYRNKTTLVIHKETHGHTTLITDSIVEFKPQFRED